RGFCIISVGMFRLPKMFILRILRRHLGKNLVSRNTLAVILENMTYKQIEYLRTVDLKNYLGYCRCNVFKVDTDFSISDVFSANLLSHKYDHFIVDNNQKRGYTSDELENDFGPFNLANTNINDFTKCSYSELVAKLNNYWND